MINDDDTITFIRSHRAPYTWPRINLVTALVSLGVILLIVTGVMINTDLGIL